MQRLACDTHSVTALAETINGLFKTNQSVSPGSGQTSLLNEPTGEEKRHGS